MTSFFSNSQKIFLFLFLSMSFSIGGYAQTSRIAARKAEKVYHKKEYNNALNLYTQAVKEYKSPDLRARFGQANALFKMNQPEKALELYSSMLEDKNTTYSPQEIADIAHNIGNIYMTQKDYPQAIQHYKRSLKANPGNEQTIYNLALAIKLQKKDPLQGGGGGGGSGASNSDQSQNSDQPQPKKDEDQRDASAEKTQKDDNHGEIGKEQAEKILDAFRKKEEKTRKKVEKRKEKNDNKNRKTKNW